MDLTINVFQHSDQFSFGHKRSAIFWISAAHIIHHPYYSIPLYTTVR